MLIHLYRRSAILIFAMVVTTTSSVALADGNLEARLSVPNVRDKTHPALVTLTLSNTGDAPVSVLQWDTPFVASGGRLPKPLFIVKSSSGIELDYSGAYVNFGRVKMDSFLTVQPGEILTKDVDLIHEYRYGNGGVFTVKYELDLTREPDADIVPMMQRAKFKKNTQKHIESNEITLVIDGPVDPVDVQTIKNNDDEDECSPTQALTIANVNYLVFAPIFAASKYMSERYRLERGEDGRFHYVFKPHPRYTKWFGSHDENEPSLGQPGWGEGDNAQVFETIEAMLERQSSNDGRTFVAKCGCPGVSPGHRGQSDPGYNLHHVLLRQVLRATRARSLYITNGRNDS